MSKEQFTALLGTGTEYHGQLTFEGAVRIDGNFIGDINSKGKLILGKDAVVKGKINVNEIVVHGTLNGDITVGKRTTLLKTAIVTGNITTHLLAMEEGACLQGKIIMRPDEVSKSPELQKILSIAPGDERIIQLDDNALPQ